MAALGAGAFASLLHGRAGGAEKKRPNFLFFLTDDQRFNTIHALGCADVSTPHQDALVRNGASFTHACIMGGLQGAICAPSRNMIMSGRTLFHLPGNGGEISPDCVTMPELLRKNGYATFATGKWHNDKPALQRSFESARAVFFGGMGNHFATPLHDLATDGKITPAGQSTGFDAEVFADAAIGFLKEQKGDKPFFAYVSFKTPHDPRKGPAKFHEMYDAAKMPLPPNFMPEHPFDNGEMKIRDEMLEKFPRTPDAMKKHIADYYALTTATDDQVGRIMQALKDAGHADDTVIIFAGDNGLAVGQHGLMGKQNLYDHSIRVPLLFSGPGIPKDMRTDALCYLLDIYPTVCALAGIEPPANVEGRNLLPVMTGAQKSVRDEMLYAYRDIQRAVRTRDYKLIEYDVKGAKTTQLFDMQNDPWELKNLASDPQHAETVKKYAEMLAKLRKEYADRKLDPGGDAKEQPKKAGGRKAPKGE
jgi:arylsulfatase A-like enzyme